jgi:excisionase family DNA binding protein
MPVEQRYITVEAIARDLDISPDLVRLWIRQKLLPAVKIGKEYRIKREDYEKFLEERRTDQRDEP